MCMGIVLIVMLYLFHSAHQDNQCYNGYLKPHPFRSLCFRLMAFQADEALVSGCLRSLLVVNRTVWSVPQIFLRRSAVTVTLKLPLALSFQRE